MVEDRYIRPKTGLNPERLAIQEEFRKYQKYASELTRYVVFPAYLLTRLEDWDAEKARRALVSALRPYWGALLYCYHLAAWTETRDYKLGITKGQGIWIDDIARDVLGYKDLDGARRARLKLCKLGLIYDLGRQKGEDGNDMGTRFAIIKYFGPEEANKLNPSAAKRAGIVAPATVPQNELGEYIPTTEDEVEEAAEGLEHGEGDEREASEHDIAPDTAARQLVEKPAEIGATADGLPSVEALVEIARSAYIPPAPAVEEIGPWVPWSEERKAQLRARYAGRAPEREIERKIAYDEREAQVEHKRRMHQIQAARQAGPDPDSLRLAAVYEVLLPAAGCRSHKVENMLAPLGGFVKTWGLWEAILVSHEYLSVPGRASGFSGPMEISVRARKVLGDGRLVKLREQAEQIRQAEVLPASMTDTAAVEEAKAPKAQEIGQTPVAQVAEVPAAETAPVSQDRREEAPTVEVAGDDESCGRMWDHDPDEFEGVVSDREEVCCDELPFDLGERVDDVPAPRVARLEPAASYRPTLREVLYEWKCHRIRPRQLVSHYITRFAANHPRLSMDRRLYQGKNLGISRDLLTKFSGDIDGIKAAIDLYWAEQSDAELKLDMADFAYHAAILYALAQERESARRR